MGKSRTLTRFAAVGNGVGLSGMAHIRERPDPAHPARSRGKSMAAFIATAALLAACSPDNGDDNGDATDPAEVEAATEITIAAAEAPWLASYQDIISDYEEETGVTVNVNVFPFDGLLTQQANAAQTGSYAFDVMLINEQWVGQFYDNEWVEPLTNVNPDFEWDDGLMEFEGVGRWDADARVTAPDGVPHALPINGNIHIFMYNQTVYDGLGLSVPTTWEEVVANGEAAMEADAIQHGFVLRGQPPTFDFSSILYSYGGKWFEDEAGGDWTPAIDSPEAREALEMWATLASLGPDAPQSLGQAEMTSVMQSGTALQGMFVAAVAASLEDPESSNVVGEVGYAVQPGGAPISGTWVLGIPTGLEASRAQAAYNFMALR